MPPVVASQGRISPWIVGKFSSAVCKNNLALSLGAMPIYIVQYPLPVLVAICHAKSLDKALEETSVSGEWALPALPIGKALVFALWWKHPLHQLIEGVGSVIICEYRRFKIGQAHAYY